MNICRTINNTSLTQRLHSRNNNDTWFNLYGTQNPQSTLRCVWGESPHPPPMFYSVVKAWCPSDRDRDTKTLSHTAWAAIIWDWNRGSQGGLLWGRLPLSVVGPTPLHTTYSSNCREALRGNYTTVTHRRWLMREEHTHTHTHISSITHTYQHVCICGQAHTFTHTMDWWEHNIPEVGKQNVPMNASHSVILSFLSVPHNGLLEHLR